MSPSLFFVFVLAISACHAIPSRQKRGFFDNLLAQASSLGGKLGSALSPEAIGSFCKAEGFTVWTGQGPAPGPPEGLLGQGLSSLGSIGGLGTKILESGLEGGSADQLINNGVTATCNSAGWQKPLVPV